MNLGAWAIDDLLTFACTTHRFDTGAATDADGAPAYRVYEDETSTPILTGTMALRHAQRCLRPPRRPGWTSLLPIASSTPS